MTVQHDTVVATDGDQRLRVDIDDAHARDRYPTTDAGIPVGNCPDCDTGFAFPEGVHDGDCECGLPAFETATGRRCLDRDCDRTDALPGDASQGL